MNFTQFVKNKLTNYDDPGSFASKLRSKRFLHFIGLIKAAYEEHGCVNILDIGGTRPYWNIVPSSLFEEKKIKR